MDKLENDQNSGGLDEEIPSMLLDDKGEGCRVPVVGMKVNSEEEAYNLYNNYAVQVGFSIRKSKTIKDTHGALRQRYFVCSKEGLRVDDDASRENKVNRLETRTNCKASIRFMVKDGIWEVTHFNPDHNHELAPPEQRKFLRSNRRITAAMIKNMVKAGMTPMQAYSFYTKQAGVADNAKMTPRDCYNLLRKERLSMIKGGDAQPVVNHFKHKQAPDRSMLFDDKGEGCRVPVVGMKVNSEEEAYNLYNNYAVQVGFSVRKSKTIKDTHGALRQRYFVCSKEGLRVDDDASRENKVNRLETRTNCKASIRFLVKDGIWEVSYFNPDHNHELAHPEQRKFLRSNWQMSVIKDMVKAGTSPIQADSSYTKQTGGVHNSRIVKGGDAQAVLNHFKHKQASDPMFFYSVKVDDEGRLMNFFCRDGRSKMDYDCFRDVVTFDTTFRTNKYNLVCAPFVGVNHHRENNYFGCAFLSDETISSFTWLFETFLESMGNKKPKIIFTDQDAAMETAIKHVFPDTCHRLCIWHIAHNSTKHLSTYYADPDFKSLFNKCLDGCLTEMEFESNWNMMINGFHLKDNKWLSSLYDLREKWCPTFSLETFSARVRSTQRSESTANVFKSMSCKMMHLIQFVHEYEEAAERQRLTESEHDFQCNQDLPIRASRSSGLLNQAANVYTVEIFQLFQKEMLESLSIVMEEISNDGTLCNYELSQEDHSMKHKVYFNTCDSTILCSCKMFESMGLLCRHALRILNLKGVTKIPPQYILKRWTKHAKQWVAPLDYGDSSCNNSEASQLIHRIGLMQKAFYVIERCSMVNGGSKVVDAYFDQSLNEVERSIVASQNEEHDQPISNSIVGDSNDNYSSLNESRMLDLPILRQKGGTIKRRASKSTVPSGKEKKHVPMSSNPTNASGIQLPHSTFLCPSFPTSSLDMVTTSFILPTSQQQHFPISTIGDSNSQFASMLPGTNLVVHENQFTRMLLGTNPRAHTRE